MSVIADASSRSELPTQPVIFFFHHELRFHYFALTLCQSERMGSRDQFASNEDPALRLDEGGNRIFLITSSKRKKQLVLILNHKTQKTKRNFHEYRWTRFYENHDLCVSHC